MFTRPGMLITFYEVNPPDCGHGVWKKGVALVQNGHAEKVCQAAFVAWQKCWSRPTITTITVITQLIQYLVKNLRVLIHTPFVAVICPKKNGNSKVSLASNHSSQKDSGKATCALHTSGTSPQQGKYLDSLPQFSHSWHVSIFTFVHIWFVYICINYICIYI